ncbi:EndoU domain-containing protein [Cellulophaga sp. E16_2]|uniref:EndoU domain-containing protein n=1 Tax=Cellulophaga sp. E16_2 TaxID=2789297 RepID=UPI001A91798C|nr:EndoU domain-containing protein [Cellulophaga sp. E16_2]MBO0590847.1 EndoU domain-containing protein [Cellulophaga sp. E16_2]
MKLHYNRYLKNAFFLAFLILASSLWGQGGAFPVQIIPQVTPPPPIYLSHYADASTINSPLRVQIILNDLNIQNREVRLKTYLQGGGISFQSNDFVTGSSSLFLEGGVPLILTNVELAPYFKFENITGISPNVYGNAIPEGTYQICFEVYDLATGNRLSSKSCATTVVFQNEPPFLISPRNKTNIAERNPQNIVFQWTPRSINVTNVEYELSLVEIWDTQIDPQAAFLSSPPIFQTTTTATTYVFGPSDPLLLSGKNYAWRIQAKAKQGTEEIGLFKNQGYSEIFSFSHASACDLPLGINHEVKGSTNANIFWDDFSTDVPEYTVRYRKNSSPSGESEGEWFFNKTTSNTTSLWDLKAGTTYEYQIQKKCAVTKSDWSITKQFTTHIADNEESVYECGITPDFSLSNTDPLEVLTKGEKFTAGDFPIHVLEVSGSNGRFTGKGYVTIPYLNSIRVGVEFTNILINTEKQLAEGTVITMFDPDLKNILDVDDAIETVGNVAEAVGEPFEGDNDLDEIHVNWDIDPDKDIKIEDGILIITNPANKATETSPLGDDKVIVDKSGQTYHIDAEGKITKGEKIDPSGGVTNGNVTGVSNKGEIEALTAKGIQVTFESDGVYGYDIMPTIENDKLNKEYTTIPDAEGGKYTLSHIAVEKEKAINVTAKVALSSTSEYNLSDLKFKTKVGELIPITATSEDNNTITLNVTGHYTLESETIYAVVTQKQDTTKQLIAGAFTLAHFEDRALNIVLVSIDKAPLPDTAEIARIFKKGVTTLNFETTTASLNGTNLLGDDDRLQIADNAWLNAYNEEQNSVLNHIKSQIENFDKNKYYVLIFNNDFKTSRSIAGFMPLQRQFGFVFNGALATGEESKGDLTAVTAHELGHGIFALQHPFTEYGTEEKATDWLMDYKDGATDLNHMNWAQMHNPALKFYVFQDEEDGEYTTTEYFEKLLQQIRCAYASGAVEIDMPEKYQIGYNNQVIVFNYGLPTKSSDLNGTKINSGEFTTNSNATKITNIDKAIINPIKGNIIFGNFKINVLVPSYSINNKISPFEHLTKYLFPTSDDIQKDFETIWINSIKQKIDSNSGLSKDDVNQLKKIASCGTNLLSTDLKYKLLKALLDVGWLTEENEEDLILDIIATTPKGNKSQELFEKINSDYDLLKNLMGSLDDFAGNEKNFLRLAKEIYALYDRAYTAQEKKTKYSTLKPENKLYFYGFDDWSCSWDINTVESNRKFLFEETAISNVEYHNTYGIGGSSITCKEETKSYSFNYDEIVAVNFIRDVSFVNFSQGSVIMPASVYYILIGVQDNENLRNQLEAFWFTLGILTPIDEFYLLGKALQYGNKGLKAIRFTNVKAFAAKNKIKVEFNSEGKKIKELSNGKIDNYVEYVNGFSDSGGKHINWTEVLEIRNKLILRKSHVLEVEGLTQVKNYRGQRLEGFTGCHSKQALDDFVSTNGGSYQIKNKPSNLTRDEVFDGQPVILKDGKEYVKTNGNFVEYQTGKYGGTSTFFPENWNNKRILDEVEHAVANNHGRILSKPTGNEYFGFSKDGKIEIHFYLNSDGTINSYFPIKNKK